MKLSELLNDVKISRLENFYDIEVKGLTDNSREVKDGFIFVALKGAVLDGNIFIEEALKNGAAGIVLENNLNWPLKEINKQGLFNTLIYAEDARRLLWQFASRFYGYPSREIRCIGITGTNGKTTTAYILESIFRQASISSGCRKFNCGVMGTVNYRYKNNIINAPNTTPSPILLQSLLSKMVYSGVDYCVMEVSSHSLEQQRVGGIDFKCAVFTNLTSDHLDYHKDVSSYFGAKAKLFKILKKDAVAVINADDAYGQLLLKLPHEKVFTYAIDSHADYMAYGLEFDFNGSRFNVAMPSGDIRINSKLIGRHNVYNILAAIAAAASEGVDLDDIIKGINDLIVVEGRLQKIEGHYPFDVFVDYAHTEDALKNILFSLREINNARKNSSGKRRGRIIVVFGCGGDRDKTKRPFMGRIASSLADHVIVTCDNPRREDPDGIINEIIGGMEKNNFEKIVDRYQAIEKALYSAAAGDIVLIAGKGHEGYQIFADRKIDFDDRKAAKEILDKIPNPEL
ncbi:MAG: UDP-N-acetylmuramoyl-L-alanyl-D-glutamate--2,6-diaminopimelate ligase [Candidatus Omnitrophica bacterium CG11_big_fil_rev_8_21_14_0_20_42_13]|uniref:UDP-N-acetylmuramoyl-L-alanyl-D-glutamate--2,6-diaminopimelate ligase n=1 Tax=Candidatus Ghiorseimicrobium undicola TaxID=1974746 RepID=A0A2H0LV91_9BACT|nr:MAG: UDP-N-acetylmuramoyl-L-alanyl-D-glutamate--2,6-diaminopimelate ligase [Candidatus Omnitrophica bacterium CG11_big_fil_rev_8_21_14_0_20_42_13]